MSEKNIIAKNTAFLYLRMFLILSVTLYTSRVVLEQLGVSDYGIYSLVGGIVAMLSFFRGAMANATRRYLAFDIGKGDFSNLKKTFSATLTIHFAIAIFVVIIAETIGLWYLSNNMVFPHERLYAVHVIYQLSVLTFVVNVIQVPYDALIQAREKMNIYALVSILEAILKLLIVYLLTYFGSDKLITFAALTFLVSLIVRTVSLIYCRRQFEESKYKFEFDKLYFKELMSYSGWNMFGSLAMVARSQGSNIILNLFFGTIVNAAYGITSQVQTAVLMFVNNFQIAMNPQIIKTYAKGAIEENRELITQGSKLSYYLLFIIICPIWVNLEHILNIWLNIIPAFTAVFIKVALISTLIDTISGPLMVGAQATGKIKWYQIVVGSLLFCNLPISFILLKTFDAEPVVVFYIMIIISVITLIFRVVFLKYMIGLKVSDFMFKVISPIIIVSIISIATIYFAGSLLGGGDSFGGLVFSICVILLINLLVIFFLGLSVKERAFLTTLYNKLIH